MKFILPQNKSTVVYVKSIVSMDEELQKHFDQMNRVGWELINLTKHDDMVYICTWNYILS